MTCALIGNILNTIVLCNDNDQIQIITNPESEMSVTPPVNTGYVQICYDDGNGNPVAVTPTNGLPQVAATTIGGSSTMSYQGGTSNPLLNANALGTVKSGSGLLYGVDFVNLNSSVAFVQIFDAASSTLVTLGTTIPKMSKWVPANGAWEEKFTGGGQISFYNGIVIAASASPTGSTLLNTGINANVTFI